MVCCSYVYMYVCTYVCMYVCMYGTVCMYVCMYVRMYVCMYVLYMYVCMIFCVRQLVEKAIEHNTKLFLLFVDLRKAYDSVPRAALWCALQKYGVPDIMIELIRSLHDGMSATVTVGGGRSEPFSVRNGLHQGCTIAPTLFILYFGLVIDRWLDQCQAAGMEVQFNWLGG